jgi:hypothetical protein
MEWVLMSSRLGAGSRTGTQRFYLECIEEFCARNNRARDEIFHRQDREYTQEEIEVMVHVYNHEKSAVMFQHIVDNIDAIMLKVHMGIAPESIFLMVNPFSVNEKCFGCIDKKFAKAN